MKILYRLLVTLLLTVPAISIIVPNQIVYSMDWIDDDPQEEDKFFQETDEKTKEIASSLYACVLVCVISIGAFALLIALIKLVNKKSQTRDEAKEHIMCIIIGLIAVFCITLFPFIATLLGNSLKF